MDIHSSESSSDDDAYLELSESSDESFSQGRIISIFEGLPPRNDTLTSNLTYVRNLPWRITICLRPESDDEEEEYMPEYLDVYLSCGLDVRNSWFCYVRFSLTLINHQDPTKNVMKETREKFQARNLHWGFKNFISLENLNNEPGYFDFNNCLTILAELEVELPHGTIWNSKLVSGYNGLKNQGATCYMNSVLQSLFFTNKLRKAVYKMPVSNDNSEPSVSLALQSVFYHLQYDDCSVGTMGLTTAFGWQTLDNFYQHDAQELFRVLLDNLESKMKGTDVETVIPDLFRGTLISYIKCVDVDFESSREEHFYDIQLPVQNLTCLRESFLQYVSVEKMEGDNKYAAGEFGLQDAKKGLSFKKFPPVLHLHLMRFYYDYEEERHFKINDRFEYPNEIDLKEFLYQDSNSDLSDSDAVYVLQAILIHSGDVSSGHYVIYVNPECKGKWFRFDDDNVVRCTQREVFEDNFGGRDQPVYINRVTSAYMLVYVRKSMVNDILEPVLHTDIPTNLRQKLLSIDKKQTENMKRKESASDEYSNKVTLMVLKEESLHKNSSTDLFTGIADMSIKFNLPSNLTLDFVFRSLVDYMGLDSECSQICLVSICNDDRYRINRLQKHHRPYSLELLQVTFPSEIQDIIFLIVDEPKLIPFIPLKLPTYILFVKYFCVRTQNIIYAGTLHLDIHYSLEFSSDKFIGLLNGQLENGTTLMFYKVFHQGVSQIHDLKVPIEQLPYLSDCDVLLFQKYVETVPENSEMSINDMDSEECVINSPKFNEVSRYLRYKSSLWRIDFMSIYRVNVVSFSLQISSFASWKHLLTEISVRLGADCDRIKISARNYARTADDSFFNLVPADCNDVLQDILSDFNSSGERKLFYEVLPCSLDEINKLSLFVCHLDWKLIPYPILMRIYVDKSATVREAINQVVNLFNNALDFPDLKHSDITNTPMVFSNELSYVASYMAHMDVRFPSDRPVRFVEVICSKIVRFIPLDSLLSNTSGLSKSRDFRIQYIPDDQLELSDSDILISVYIYENDIANNSKNFGNPFIIKVSQTDTYQDVLSKLIDSSRNQFLPDNTKFKIVLNHFGHLAQFPETEDGLSQSFPFSKIIENRMMSVTRDWDKFVPQVFIGIELEPPKTQKKGRARPTQVQKSIKILH